MPNYTTPRPTITTDEPAANANDGGATVHTLDEHFRIVADGHTVELGVRRYRAGERVPLTQQQADELEAAGGIRPMHQTRRMDLRSARPTENQIGRVTEMDGR